MLYAFGPLLSLVGNVSLHLSSHRVADHVFFKTCLWYHCDIKPNIKVQHCELLWCLVKLGRPPMVSAKMPSVFCCYR